MARNSSGHFVKQARMIVARDGAICGICGHGNAITVDHIITHENWPRDHAGVLLPGFDDPDNLRAAHGTRGVAANNPCLECDPVRWPKGRHCNQSRGADRRSKVPPEPHSREW